MLFRSFVFASLCLISTWVAAADRPNVIIVLADDLGWRDTGYNGSPVAKTPHLDNMAASGFRFDYFYSGGQMCSPGRFAILTGRTPFRTGLHHLGAIRAQEKTLAQALKSADYKTAQFGKWHLGNNETSPVKMGFDQATWSPNFFDLGAKLRVNDTDAMVPLEGDTSVACMDLALDYIRQRAAAKEPFFTYICFGSPHSPHRATDEFRALYKDHPEKQRDFYGEISGIDTAVGNLRSELRKLAIADNTVLWFTSDNGGITPQSQDPAGKGKQNVGVRTVGLLEWPARIAKPVRTSVPVAHMDIYPTVLDIVGIKVENQPVVDGISLVPLLAGEMKSRPKPLGFMLWGQRSARFDVKQGAAEKSASTKLAGNFKADNKPNATPEVEKLKMKKEGSGKKSAAKTDGFSNIDFVTDTQGVWIDGAHKLIVGPQTVGDANSVKLFDIFADPAEKTNLADKQSAEVTRLRKDLETWQRSVRDSYDGKDFAKK